MLIKFQTTLENAAGHNFETPVVGSVNDSSPVSADVHLYADPNTFLDQYPMLYADCEGLEGGESAPRAEALKTHDVTTDEEYITNSLNKRLRKRGQQASRTIAWALEDKNKSTRQYAVAELYPLLLYTFSDVVVFVLRNPK